jgi:hypothetical protein
MSPLAVIGLHVAALVLAYLGLVVLHEQPWYWHVLSIVAAVWVGVRQVQGRWSSPESSLSASLAFAFLLLWGFAGPVLGEIHRQSRETHSRP